MNNMLALLALLSPASVIVALLVIAQLSQRLGAVTKRPPIYRWFYISIVMVVVAILSRAGALLWPVALEATTALLYDMLIMVALVISLVVAWRYWSWLLSERGQGR